VKPATNKRTVTSNSAYSGLGLEDATLQLFRMGGASD